MANTHYYLLAGDIHVRGQQHIRLPIVDPILGHVLTTFDVPTVAPTINTIVRGATSGTWGRIVRILDSKNFVLESFPYPGVGQPGAGFIVGFPFGETLNFDNGGTAHVSLAAPAQTYPLFNQFTSQHLDLRLNSFTPSDRSDKPYWHPKAKFSRQIVLLGASVIGDTLFVQGNRFTTSGGASGTILLGNAVGADYGLQIIRTSGTFNPGDTLSVTVGATTNVATILSVGVDPQQGAWLEHHVLPNFNGSSAGLWEFPPHSQNPDYGPGVQIVRMANALHGADPDVANRASRVIPFATVDDLTDDSTLGGVTVQVVKCTGTFPTSWIQGEPVTGPGGWSATVHGFSASNKYLFVIDTNGQTLTAGTVTATFSGAAATTANAAYGWQKGSTHYNSLMAEVTKAIASPDALYGGAAAKWEGVFLMPFDSDVSTFSAAVGAAWPSIQATSRAWSKLCLDLRTHLGNPTLPIAVWQHDVRARSDVTSGGYNYALHLRIQIDGLPAIIPNLTIVRSDGFEFAHDPTIGTPQPTSLTFLRTEDYQTIGERAWRAMRLYSREIPSGNYELFPIIVIAGQSQMVGNIPAGTLMGLDRDPLLYPSASFPGVDTQDPNVLSFNTLTGEWEVMDVAVNCNHFFGMASGTCGPEVPIMARHKKRWSKMVGETGRIGLLKLAVSASSASAAALTAPATWDSNLTAAPQTSANCAVTVIPAVGFTPAKGRFTATAGTFSSGWSGGMAGFVEGSALGVQSFGGNNTAPQSTTFVAAVDPAGAWIEFYGTFVAEGALGTGTGYLVNNGGGYAIGASVIAADTGTGTILVGDRIKFAGHATIYTLTAALSGGSFTVTPTLTASVANNEAITVQRVTFTLHAGPHALAPLVEIEIRRAFDKAMGLRLIPFPVLAVWENGEADVGVPTLYKEALLRDLRWLETVLGGRLKGQDRIAKVIVKLSNATPSTPSDETLAQIRQIQDEVAAELENAVTVDPSALPMEASGVWPITSRLHNGLHRTARGHLMCGYMVDAASEGLVGIPAHPDGPAAIDFGIDGGGGTITVDGAGADVGGTDAVAEVVVEDGTGLAGAESYITLDEFKTMAGNLGANATIEATSDEQIHAYLRLSGRYGVDFIFGDVWTGLRDVETQGLDWPRVGAFNRRTRRAVTNRTVPVAVKEAQFWYAYALALGMDPLQDVNMTDDEQRDRWATSISVSLPGGLSESKTFAQGAPRVHVLHRMHAAAAAVIAQADDSVGIA